MRRPVGEDTRGTTAPNRLRRIDRWLVATQARRLRAAADPLVVDLGYGASPVTTVELADRLAVVRPDVEVVGLEIDSTRVERARSAQRARLSFRRGGFELPLGGRRPVLVRAVNVLRQYDVAAAQHAWELLRAGLAPDGVVVEGTCDELGRLATWVTLDVSGPVTLTLSARLATLQRPSQLAERLPKVLIHRNVTGEPVHHLLGDLDRAWASAAPLQPFGPRQRWQAAVRSLPASWRVLPEPRRWSQGELTVPWSSVAPRG